MTPVADAAHPDADLLRRFAGGDEAAFAEIVERYAGLVFRCHRVLGDRGWAEDVAQETFFRLLKSRRRVTQSLGGWLHRAATRLAVDALRSETARRRREAFVAAEAYDVTPDPADDAAGPTWAEVSPQVDAALAELPDDERELLVRHFLEGVPQSKIAAERGVSTATLSRRMRDAVAALRLHLSRRGVTVAAGALFLLMSRNAAEGAAPAALTGGLAKMAMISGHTFPPPPALSAPAKASRLSCAARARVGLVAAGALGIYLALPYLWLPFGTPVPPRDDVTHERTTDAAPPDPRPRGDGGGATTNSTTTTTTATASTKDLTPPQGAAR